ncbi:MFS transporter [Mycolicibacterium sp.]|uniref:MFS transporter n=1 Tax=Mycolicibacterium sp. TaxID=2320850 RepID=UPI003D102C5C
MTSHHTTDGRVNRYVVVGICFAAIVFDGYDLISYGSTIPALLDYEPWALTRAQVGAIGSYALMGMFFGALTAGPLTDRFGRRALFLGCLCWYSVAMLAVALAPTPELLGVFRFAAGLGFGGIAPVAIAVVVEVARPHERNRLNSLMLAGLPVGGVIAALLALWLLEPLGFRALWGMGALALILVVPPAWKYLPETAATTDAPVPAAPAATSRLRKLLSPTAIGALLCFAAANFVGFLLVFGLNIWLPELMRESGYSLGSALRFQLLLNAGAVAGGIFGSTLADRYGSRRVAASAFLVATAATAAMATAPPHLAMYFVVLLAGAGSIGTQIVLFGYVATHYPIGVRATALGITTGIGRLGAVTGPILGGALLSAGVPLGWIFTTFGAIALVGGIACLLVPRQPADGHRASTVPASRGNNTSALPRSMSADRPGVRS